jgi:hopanoid biosynthesis associated radical SAM protein HpnH
MRFPISLYQSLTKCFVKNAISGRKRFPLVLMLEPTHRCNLACAGCDRIRLHDEMQSPDLSLEQCIEAVKESDAPVITVTGGEPLLYGELKPLVRELLRMKKHVYLCTNGLLTESFIAEFDPSPRLTINFHLDGLEETHDSITNRKGTFRKTIETIKMAKQRGFRVSTNTSVYKNSDIKELEQLFEMLTEMSIDGTLIAPAFSYESVGSDIFLSRDEIWKKFNQMASFFERFPFMNSPLYVDVLKGNRQMDCTPWGNPTRNPLGWKSPCYLITDAYYASFSEMMERTPWDRYGTGNDPRCKNCLVHSGYEATVMRTAFANPKDLLRLLAWNLSHH